MKNLTAAQARKLIESWRLYCSVGPLYKEGAIEPIDAREGILRCADELERLAQQPEAAHCHAGKDGECNWKECPQKREYKSWCPLAISDDDAAPQQPERVVERPPCESGEPSWPSALTPPENYSDPSKPQAVGLREAEYFVSEYVAVVKSKYSRGDCIQALARLLATPAPATVMTANEMLEQVKCSLREWPIGACDKEIGELVWQIVENSKPAAAEKVASVLAELKSRLSKLYESDYKQGFADAVTALERSGLPGDGK